MKSRNIGYIFTAIGVCVIALAVTNSLVRNHGIRESSTERSALDEIRSASATSTKSATPVVRKARKGSSKLETLPAELLSEKPVIGGFLVEVESINSERTAPPELPDTDEFWEIWDVEDEVQQEAMLREFEKKVAVPMQRVRAHIEGEKDLRELQKALLAKLQAHLGPERFEIFHAWWNDKESARIAKALQQ